MKIADDPAFAGDNFVQVGRADALVKIPPALTGSYEVSHIKVDAPLVNIIRTKDGFNFDSLGAAKGKKQPTDEPPSPAAPT